MIILGNLCLIAAAFFYFRPLQRMLHAPVSGGAEILWATLIVIAPLWLLLTTALCAATTEGGFDWLFPTRPPQYLVVLVVGVAMMVVTGFSLFGRFAPTSQPASTRWLTGWAVQVFPLVVMGFCLVVLNRKFTSWIPALTYRIPMTGAAAISLLASGGLLIEWIYSIWSQGQSKAN